MTHTLIVVRHAKSDWDVPVGGMGQVPEQLANVARRAGAEGVNHHQRQDGAEDQGVSKVRKQTGHGFSPPHESQRVATIAPQRPRKNRKGLWTFPVRAGWRRPS